MSALVSPAWLAAHLGDDDVRVLDGSWYLKAAARDPSAEFAAEHVPGARFFDIDAIADPASPLPHMLPTADAFAAAVGALGVARDDHVVVYDGGGLFSAPRVWWTFRVFGHPRVSVLDGGLPAWKAAGYPVTGAPSPIAPAVYAGAALDPTLVRSLDEMRAIVAGRRAQVLDARSAARFHGTQPEARPGVRSGHMPGAASLPQSDLVADGHLKTGDALRNAVVGAGVDLEGPIVCSCGSGITACILALGLHELGRGDVAVYDGSWTEWGSRDDTPIAS